ncbi:hypothetical protein NIES4071_94970 [Calothrix sp. NIES-4071]|nr:hypothetical protein NIES4071_94970 [Calothrix sp. NIES-4071]BAZ63762.1 hypothetical protein NIES4105_94900 [Calothrix sp. NIES-4105]
MNSSNIRTRLAAEIDLIPEEKLDDLYNFIHSFRLGVENSQGEVDQIMKFAGCWNEMPDEVFADLNEEIITRRQQSFLKRRDNETILD